MRSFLTASHWGLGWLEKNCGGKRKQHQRETLAFLDPFFKISRLFKGWMEENKGWCSDWRGNIKHTSAGKGERGERLCFSFERSLIWAHVTKFKELAAMSFTFQWWPGLNTDASVLWPSSPSQYENMDHRSFLFILVYSPSKTFFDNRFPFSQRISDGLC